MVDTDHYLPWLRAHAEDLGVRLVRREIIGELREQESGLLDEFGADVLINGTGLGVADRLTAAGTRTHVDVRAQISPGLTSGMRGVPIRLELGPAT